MRFLPLFAAIFAITPLAIDMYLPALLTIAEELNAPIESVQNSLSIYLAGYALGMFLFGPMVDKYGRRVILISGLTGFVVFTFLVSTSQSIESFLAFRFFQALSGSAATVVVPGAIKHLFGKDTAKGMSYVAMTMAIAPMIAPAFGTYILLVSSWQWIFIALIVYALLLIVVSYRWFPNFESNQSIQTTQPISFLNRYKVVFKTTSCHNYLLATMLASLIFFTYLTSVSFMYMEVFQLSKEVFSFYFGLNILGLILVSFINTRLVPRFGSEKILFAASILLLILTTTFFILNFINAQVEILIGFLIACVSITTMIGSNADSLTLQKFNEHTGTATAVIGTLRFGSGAIAGPLLALSFDGSVFPIATLFLIAGFALVAVLLRHKKILKSIDKQNDCSLECSRAS